ncbi:hypothetical protein CLAIMM_13430 isoform 1 [Cladophialophora immunda]|nr:hypothetical protein CLAIMM_13430 isoform 1 [Cladophialophora immunda]
MMMVTKIRDKAPLLNGNSLQHEDAIKEIGPEERLSRPRPHARSMGQHPPSASTKKITGDLEADLRETRYSNQETRDSNRETRDSNREVMGAVIALQNTIQNQTSEEKQMAITRHQEQMATLTANHEAQMGDQETRHQERMEALTANREVQMGNQETRHQEQMEALTANHVAQMGNRETLHQEQIATLTANHEARMRDQETRHQEQMAILRANHEAQMENQETRHQEADGGTYGEPRGSNGKSGNPASRSNGGHYPSHGQPGSKVRTILGGEDGYLED